MSPGRDTSSGQILKSPAAPSLPPSVEAAYRAKCIQLRQRMQEVEHANDEYRVRKARLVRGIRKMRLERAILLEALSKRMHKGRGDLADGGYDDDTEDSTDSPPTPQERPMRIKRSHRRPDASFIHESTPSRPGGPGDNTDGGDGGMRNAGADNDDGGEDGGKDEDMADGVEDGNANAGDESRRSVDYGASSNANNADGHSNAGDSEMAQD